MDTTSSDSDPATPGTTLWEVTRLWRTALALALFAAAMWLAWLGWDHEYYKVDGVWQGPYRSWQVVGCGLSIATATVFAFLRVPRPATVFVLAIAADIGVAVPWAVDASSDETGMWVVGLFLLLVGGCLGLTTLLAVTNAVTGSRRSTTRDLVVCCALTVLAVLVFLPLAIVPLAGAAWVFFARWLPDRRRATIDGAAR
jgi:hypothetical protein